MTKEEFLNDVRDTSNESDEGMLRAMALAKEFDPHLARLYSQWNEAFLAARAYCRSKLEGK